MAAARFFGLEGKRSGIASSYWLVETLRGLQSRVRRFDSDPRLQNSNSRRRGRLQRLQVPVYGAEIDLRHPRVRFPRHRRSVLVAPPEVKALDEFLLGEPVHDTRLDRRQIGRHKPACGLFEHQPAGKSGAGETAGQLVPLRVATMAIRHGVREITPMFRGARRRGARGRWRRRSLNRWSRTRSGTASRRPASRYRQEMRGCRGRDRWGREAGCYCKRDPNAVDAFGST